MAISNPKVCIVILVYSDYEEIVQCLESLSRISYDNYEIIIIDNSSPENIYDKLKSKYPQHTVFRTLNNLGYAGGMNYGISIALKRNPDYILIMNHDVVVNPHFLEHMTIAMNNNMEIGAVSPKVLYKNQRDKIYCAGSRINYLTCAAESMNQGKYDRITLHDKFIDVAEGCCILFRSELFNTVGFFDEEYFMYFEDMELSKRIRTKYKIYLATDAIIYHRSGAGVGWHKHTPLYQYYYTRNRLKYFSGYHAIYCIYVICFSIILVLAKSTIVMIANSENKIKSLNALWYGLASGIRIMINNKIKW